MSILQVLCVGIPLLRFSATTFLSVCISTKLTPRVVLSWLRNCFPFCHFRLDAVLDSITLRHDSAASLCWRVPFYLLFLSLHRQDKGTNLIVSVQHVCFSFFSFCFCILFDAGCSSVGARVSGTRRGVSLLASAINCGGGYSQGYTFG